MGRKDKLGVAFLYFTAIILSTVVLASILAASIYKFQFINNAQTGIIRIPGETTHRVNNNLVYVLSRYCVAKANYKILTSSQDTSPIVNPFNIGNSVESKDIELPLHIYMGSINYDIDLYQLCNLFTYKSYRMRNLPPDIKSIELKAKEVNLTIRLSFLSFGENVKQSSNEQDLYQRKYHIIYNTSLSVANPFEGSAIGITDFILDITFKQEIIVNWTYPSGSWKTLTLPEPLKNVKAYAIYDTGKRDLNIQVKPLDEGYTWLIKVPFVLSLHLKRIEIHTLTASGIPNEIDVEPSITGGS